MASVTVDVDLDEFETYELVEEIKSRTKSFRRRQQLTEAQKADMKEEVIELMKLLNMIPNKTELPDLTKMVDKIKFDHIISVFTKYSLEEIERLIP